ncbi:putative immunity protein [Agromyces bauzanensis]
MNGGVNKRSAGGADGVEVVPFADRARPMASWYARPNPSGRSAPQRRELNEPFQRRASAFRCRPVWEAAGMPSPQSLSESDRREVAAWAADCAERVLGVFETEAPADGRPRDAIARARAFARGELDAAGEIRRRFVAGRAARAVSSPAAMAAARAAAQAAGVPHMGAHALGAAAYAANAAGLAAPDGPEVVRDEISWQLERMTDRTRSALRQLPLVGEDSAGPLGSGLLASGTLGSIIRQIQAALSSTSQEDGFRQVILERDRVGGELASRRGRPFVGYSSAFHKI